MGRADLGLARRLCCVWFGLGIDAFRDQRDGFSVGITAFWDMRKSFRHGRRGYEVWELWL